jgi:hypothetical protein
MMMPFLNSESSSHECGEQKNFWLQLNCRLGHGTVVVLIIGLAIVLAGRLLVMSLAAGIYEQQSGSVVHQIMPVVYETGIPEDEQEPEYLIKPFAALNETNNIEIDSSQIIETESYWNLNWWSQYLLKQMTRMEPEQQLSQARLYRIYRDDGISPGAGFRKSDDENEWLLCEYTMESRTDRTQTLKTAWHPELGLSYFRLDSPQYLHGELMADQAILDQASDASRVFISQLHSWLRSVTSGKVRIPVALLDSWPSYPSRYEMEGMICHVIYEDGDGEGSFVVFYNVAIMQVVGFAGII